MKMFMYSAATLFVLLMAIILVWYAFFPHVHPSNVQAAVFGGLTGLVSIVIGGLLAMRAS